MEIVIIKDLYSNLIKKPLILFVAQLMVCINYIIDTYEKNYNEFLSHPNKIGSMVIAALIVSSVILLSLFGIKFKMVPVVTLISCVIYGFKDTLSILFPNNNLYIPQWSWFITVILISLIIYKYFTATLYFFSFLLYVSLVVLLISLHVRPDAQENSYINNINPIVTIGVFLISFYLLRKHVVNYMFSYVVALLALRIYEISFKQNLDILLLQGEICTGNVLRYIKQDVVAVPIGHKSPDKAFIIWLCVANIFAITQATQKPNYLLKRIICRIKKMSFLKKIYNRE